MHPNRCILRAPEKLAHQKWIWPIWKTFGPAENVIDFLL